MNCILKYWIEDNYSNNYAQLGKDEVNGFSFSFVAVFFCLNVLSFHYVPCSLIVQTYIYIDVYIREIYSVLLMFLFYCWIKLFSKLLLPVTVSKLL